MRDLRRRAFRLWCVARVRPGRLARFGAGSVIVPPATILCPERIEIAEGVLVFEQATFSLVREHWGGRYEPRLRIGAGTVIGPGTWFSCVREIELGAEVLVGPGVLIADAHHGFGDGGIPILRQPMAAAQPVRIGDGAYLGAGCAVMAGVEIGSAATVLPGAVVWQDVPARSVAAGNPAEVILRFDPVTESWSASPDPRWAPTLAGLRAAH